MDNTNQADKDAAGEECMDDAGEEGEDDAEGSHAMAKQIAQMKRMDMYHVFRPASPKRANA
jgi:hypothetical protein